MARLVITPTEERNEWFPKIEIADRICFPADDPYPVAGAWWWVELEDGEVVGYAALKPAYPGGYFLARAGVVPSARGRGLQLKLIRARSRYAVRMGADCIFTYTSPDNTPSARNLARASFLPYDPAWAWAGAPGAEALYWHREFES